MEYACMIFLVVISFYTFSYAKYSWDRNNKLGAVGAALLAVLSIVYPAILLFTR